MTTKVIYNGQVYLNRGTFCEALLIKGGKIAGTGSSRAMLDEAPAGAERIDAAGSLVLPAFHDSHLHLMWIGRRARGINGVGAASIDEVVSRGRDLIARLRPPPGTFIQGAGVNPDLFSIGEKRDLRREDLDRISTEYPVTISRHCGHILFCNSLALKEAGLSEAAPEVEGGTVEKDGDGRPSGVLRENACALVRKRIPPSSAADMKSFLKLGMEQALSLGITAIGSFDTDGADFDAVREIYRGIYDESRETGRPAPRVCMQCGISGQDELLEAYFKRGILTGTPLWEDGEWGTFLKMGPIKLFADGTLGGRTAWMRRPYRDSPGTRGFPVLEAEELRRLVRKAAGGGMQVTIHAIGDAGIETSLAAIEDSIEAGSNPLRHGIIHCQITTGDLLERMARNRILALVQPVFLSDDLCVLESRVGPELASTSYAWGSMDRLGIPVSYGTDAPVSLLDPLWGISWAVLRRPPEDPESSGFYPSERVDVAAAVDAYTMGSAFASFDERVLGRIAPGFLADLVFLDRNIFSIDPSEIHRAKVLRTMIAGETVYSAS